MQVEAWDSEARLAHLRLRREQAARRRRRQRLALAGLAALALAAVGVSFVYAGSSSRLAEGVTISGVDVGGLEPERAVRLLEQREAALAATPLPVSMGNQQVEARARALGIEIDWDAAVADAQAHADGFRPLRGLRRLTTRAFGTEIVPRVAVDDQKLEQLLARMSGDSVAYRDASIRLVGLRPVVVAERAGLGIDAREAKAAIVGAFASFDRSPVALERRELQPHVTAEMLQPALATARTAVSRPVRLVSRGGFTLVTKRQLARLIELPAGGETTLSVGGPAADAYFAKLAKSINRPPRNAGFVLASGDRVAVKPSADGRVLDVPRTAKNVFAAALRPERRSARIVVASIEPSRTTADAKAMGIGFVLSSFKTYNAGDYNRITNLRLGVQAIDGTLVRPGATFSLNSAIGERTEERGFRSAPVILGNKYAEEIGGGTSQVATTVFNAAWEAGLEIAERNPHALYISRYPLGRDATVYWPSLDLKFVNDTANWVLVKGFVEPDGIRVALYGGERRRVVSSPGTFEYRGAPPVKRVKDRSLVVGTTVVEEAGTRPSSTSVTRTIYAEDGKLLRTETWPTNYRGETRVIRVGTKPKPTPKSKATEPPATEPAPDTVGPGV